MLGWKKCQCGATRPHVKLFDDARGLVSSASIFSVTEGDMLLDAGVNADCLDATQVAKLKEDLRTFNLPATPRDMAPLTGAEAEAELKAQVQDMAGLSEAEINEILDTAVNQNRITQKYSERIRELVKTVEPQPLDPRAELLRTLQAMGIAVVGLPGHDDN